MNTLQAGDNAPQFTLLDKDDRPVSLIQFKGKRVLVYFYPKAMTPGCNVQAQGLRDNIDALNNLNVVVLGISPDATKRLVKFTDKYQLNFSLLCDEDHRIAEDFGVWGLKKFMGKEYDGIHRISFLIDQDGVIEHVFNKFKTKEHHTIVLDYLNA